MHLAASEVWQWILVTVITQTHPSFCQVFDNNKPNLPVWAATPSDNLNFPLPLGEQWCVCTCIRTLSSVYLHMKNRRNTRLLEHAPEQKARISPACYWRGLTAVPRGAADSSSTRQKKKKTTHSTLTDSTSTTLAKSKFTQSTHKEQPVISICFCLFWYHLIL